MLKKFNDYVKQYSNDIKTFSNKVAIATNEDFGFSYFNTVKSAYDLQDNIDIPVIVSESFVNDSIAINESNGFTYNVYDIPKIEVIQEGLKDRGYILKTITDIKDIKNIKFPILAKSKDAIDEFKTVGKLKSCERIYDSFIENPIPKTKFTILSFKNNPISIIETINKYPLDVDIKNFKFINEVNDIVKDVYEKYGNLDFYNLELIESVKGGIYLTGINKKMSLNPHQAKLVYEHAYQDYYKSRLPKWAKEQIFNESVIPYYEKKALDSNLRTSIHAMNYSKYIKNGNS